jgi:hypothetical protein
MLDTALVPLILIPVLVFWLSRKPRNRNEVLPDYIIPPGVEVKACATHWGVPAGVARFDSALFSEVMCHPDFVERDVPDVWFKWSAADARKRARRRLLPPQQVAGVLSILKQA